MKVLHVVSSVFKNGGGTSEVVPKICSVQQKAGLQVVLACRDVGSLSDTAIQAQRDGVVLRLFRGMCSPLNKISFSWDMMRNFGKIVKDADVVHVHGGWLFSVWWGAHVARKYGKPYVVMPHGSLEPERLKISKWKKRIVGWLFDKRVYRHAAAVWVTADSEAESVRRYGVKCRVDVVPLGLEVEKYEAACRDTSLLERVGLDCHRKIVLFFSRITWIKGLDMLAEAWSYIAPNHKDWQLAIVGPDDYHGYRKVVEAEFARLCPDGSYAFTGPVYGDDKFAMLKSASLFVLPTRTENFSIAVEEALATGIPVVCTKGAPWRQLVDNGCGWWVDVSVDAIKSALEGAMSLSEDVLARMGKRGQAFVKSAFSWDSIAQCMVSSYRFICSDGRECV